MTKIENKQENTESNELQGLNGWLILVGLGILIAPIRMIVFLYTNYIEIFNTGIWEALTTSGTEFYVVGFGSLLMVEVSINILLLFSTIYLAYLFFTKKALFPKLYMAIVIFSFIFIIIDSYVASLVFPEEKIFDKETLRELAKSAIAVFIWVPYMLTSKRVKATFVN